MQPQPLNDLNPPPSNVPLANNAAVPQRKAPQDKKTLEEKKNTQAWLKKQEEKKKKKLQAQLNGQDDISTKKKNKKDKSHVNGEMGPKEEVPTIVMTNNVKEDKGLQQDKSHQSTDIKKKDNSNQNSGQKEVNVVSNVKSSQQTVIVNLNPNSNAISNSITQISAYNIYSYNTLKTDTTTRSELIGHYLSQLVVKQDIVMIYHKQKGQADRSSLTPLLNNNPSQQSLVAFLNQVDHKCQSKLVCIANSNTVHSINYDIMCPFALVPSFIRNHIGVTKIVIFASYIVYPTFNGNSVGNNPTNLSNNKTDSPTPSTHYGFLCPFGTRNLLLVCKYYKIKIIVTVGSWNKVNNLCVEGSSSTINGDNIMGVIADGPVSSIKQANIVYYEYIKPQMIDLVVTQLGPMTTHRAIYEAINNY